LLRLARLNVVEAYPVLLAPGLQAMADILRAVVAPDGRHGYRSPAQVRERQKAEVARAA